MMAKYIGENPEVALRSNWLTVNGETLRADVLEDARSEKLAVSAEELESILLLGRRAIVGGIEEFYAEQVAKNPGYTVSRPSIWTAQFGTLTQTDGRNSKVFTEAGYANGGVIASVDEIQPEFHAHWHAVKEAGFLPEVRRTSGGRDGGAWLLLRKPSLDEVLEHWFDRPENSTKRAVELIADDDREAERRNLTQYRIKGEEAVDAASDTPRSREQIGLLLSMAAIKSALGNTAGYEEEVDDAFTYADNDPSIDASTMRAMENSTFEIE